MNIRLQNRKMPGQIMMKKRENIIFRGIWGDYADILAEIGQQKEAFVFYIMAAVVSLEDQQDATVF